MLLCCVKAVAVRGWFGFSAIFLKSMRVRDHRVMV